MSVLFCPLMDYIINSHLIIRVFEMKDQPSFTTGDCCKEIYMTWLKVWTQLDILTQDKLQFTRVRDQSSDCEKSYWLVYAASIHTEIL